MKLSNPKPSLKDIIKGIHWGLTIDGLLEIPKWILNYFSQKNQRIKP